MGLARVLCAFKPVGTPDGREGVAPMGAATA
jgi:hypothetical protein